MPRRYDRRRNDYNTDARQILATFDSVCAETGKPINTGEPCIYYPLNKQVFCLESKQAQEFREVKADEAMGYAY